MSNNSIFCIGAAAMMACLFGGTEATAGIQFENPPSAEQPFENQDLPIGQLGEPLENQDMPIDPLGEQDDNQDMPVGPLGEGLGNQDFPIPPSDLQSGDGLNIRPKPAAIVDRQLTGWHQAGPGINEDRIGSLLRANWVMLNETQGLDGRVIGVSDPATISLLRGGFLVGQTTTNDYGEFSFESASPGPYTIVGNSYDRFFAFGFNAVQRNDQVVHMPLIIEPMPAIGIENIHLIAKLVREYSSSVKFDPYPKWDIGETSEDPPEYYGWSGLKNLNQPAFPATTISHQAIELLDDGRFIGRIHQTNNRTGRPIEIKKTEIKILQNGELVAETQADVLGVFEVAGLVPGHYCLVAVGADGFAAIGFELIDNRGFQQSGTDSESLHRNISFQDPESLAFDAQLSDPEAMGWINVYVDEQEYDRAMNEQRPVPGEMPYDYFSYPEGGFGGGDSGYGFGDNLGELLMWGAIGVAIADSARSEVIFGGPVQVVSPFTPNP